MIVLFEAKRTERECREKKSVRACKAGRRRKMGGVAREREEERERERERERRKQ